MSDRWQVIGVRVSGIDILLLHGTYPHNRSGPNNTRYHDKGGTGEENHKRDLPFQVEVNSPEKGERD